MDMRIGIGFDIHRLVEGRKLVLAGVEFDGTLGLLGHSDADVVLHAVADAILGAAALGDIGEHFPDNDPKWSGADSAELLKHVVGLARAADFEPWNVDVNVIAEYPRIGERKRGMSARLAAILGLPVERVSVKARSMEGLGPIGNREAVAAQVVALLQKID